MVYRQEKMTRNFVRSLLNRILTELTNSRKQVLESDKNLHCKLDRPVAWIFDQIHLIFSVDSKPTLEMAFSVTQSNLYTYLGHTCNRLNNRKFWFRTVSTHSNVWLSTSLTARFDTSHESSQRRQLDCPWKTVLLLPFYWFSNFIVQFPQK